MKALLLILVAFDFQTTTGNVTMVQTCPETKTEWDQRSTIFTCEDGNIKYHCAMTTTGNLVEVCITPMNITENEKGCPMVYIQKSVAIWVSSLTQCPVQNKECPQVGHGGYSTEQLYKYPPCFRNITERISEDNNIIQTTGGTRATTSSILQEEACKLHFEYFLITLMTMVLLLASLHVHVCLVYLRIRKHFNEAEVMKSEGSRPYSHISSLSLRSSLGEVMKREGSRPYSHISGLSSKSSMGEVMKREGSRPSPHISSLSSKSSFAEANKKVMSRPSSHISSLSSKSSSAEVMEGEGSRPSSHISSLSSKSSSDSKGNVILPLVASRRRRRKRPHKTVSEKKDMKRNDDTPLSVTDTRTRTGGLKGSQSLKQEQNTQL